MINPTKAEDSIRRKAQVHLWRLNDEGMRVYAALWRCAAKGEYWQPVTGNADPGESPAETALREAREELGVAASPEDLSPELWVHDWRYPDRPGPLICESVFALRRHSDQLTLSSEHRAYRWLPYEEALAAFAFEGNRRGLAFVESYLASAKTG